MDQSTLSQIGASSQADSPTSPTVSDDDEDSDERGTPPDLVHRLITTNNGLFAIDLASGAETVEIGDVKLTKEIDALECSWDPADHPEKQSETDKSVTPRSGWLNPPFSRRLVKKFAKKVDKELQKCSLDHLIFLCSARVLGNQWFHEYIIDHAQHLCVPDRRLVFTNTGGKPEMPCVLLSLGETPTQFVEMFNQEGACFEMVETDDVVEDIYQFIENSVHQTEDNPGLISTSYEADEPVLNNVGCGNELELELCDTMKGYSEVDLLDATFRVEVETWVDEGDRWELLTTYRDLNNPDQEDRFIVISVQKGNPSSFLVSLQVGNDLTWQPLPVTNIRKITGEITW